MEQTRIARRVILAAAALESLAGAAMGQCAHGWASGLGQPGVTLNANILRGLAVYDDGRGPSLYACGWISAAGGAAVNRVGRWDGADWSPLGTGLSGQNGAGPRTMTVYNGELYVGGNFTTAGGVPVNRVARWNGTNWGALGNGLTGAGAPDVVAMRVFDDGNGPALYVGGIFDTAGGLPVSNIAKWDGAAWSALAGGPGPDGAVNALEVFNDGAGSALYAGGAFANVGGAPAAHVARFNGASWSALGAGLNPNHVDALTVHNDGSGPALYAGGLFSSSGATSVSNVARWEPSTQTWSPVGGGTSGQVSSLASFDDDGAGPHAANLYAGGAFAQAGGQQIAGIARWNGSGWSSAGSGTTITVGALQSWNDPQGPALYAAGSFGGSSTFSGLLADNIARFNGASWSPLGTGMDNAVLAAVPFDDGTGLALYAAGQFTSAAGVPANRIAKRIGSTWTAIGPAATNGLNNTARALAVYTAGGAHDLYVGGDFTSAGGLTVNHIAKWDGTTWSLLGSTAANGLSGTVNAIAVYDDGTGPAVYAGGAFATAGGVAAANIAKWTPGSGAWAPVGSGTNGAVDALFVYDEDGAGPNPPALFAGGAFTTAGGVAVNRVARWNGSAWSSLPGASAVGVNGTVMSFGAFNDGSGQALYVGGTFTTAGGTVVNRIAKWNGSSWSSLGTGSGTGTSGAVNAMAVYDDGSGSALFLGGAFSSVGGQSAGHIARWTGSWSPVGGDGMDTTVNALAAFPADPAGSSLWLGGSFSTADSKPSGNIARWTLVGPAPVITMQPQSHLAYTTQPAFMSVAATGSNLAYQWRFAGVPLMDGGRVAGATTPVLTISNVQLSDLGLYDVIVYGCNGSTISAAALLNVVCYSNCDASTVQPVLNINDFICFQNRFAQGAAYANCDGSTTTPALNINDFICFQNRFASGCN